MRHGLLILVLAGTASTPAANADDSLMCRSSLVTVGMAAAEVVSKCGEPKDKTVEDRPIRARTRAGGTVQTSTYHVELWTYDRGSGRFPAVLMFEEGKLKTIQLITR
jgi:hypothetical protein